MKDLEAKKSKIKGPRFHSRKCASYSVKSNKNVMEIEVIVSISDMQNLKMICCSLLCKL
jgi:peroxiredoxin family protein